MNNSGKNGSTIIWILLLIGLGLALWLALKPSSKSNSQTQIQELPSEYPVEINDGIGSAIQNPKTNYIPQHSENNPKMESVDPFTTHEDFETVLKSTKNKTDFDFDFGNLEKVPNYQPANGSIDFELAGSLKTRTVLEDNLALSLTFFKNDQISFTKRKSFQTFDLPFIRETEMKSDADKILYRFDFSKKIKSLESGLYYYLIIPTGRNRVLYGGKFTVK